MALWHRDAWERSWGNVLNVIGGEIASQRLMVATKGFIGLHSKTSERPQNLGSWGLKI